MIFFEIQPVIFRSIQTSNGLHIRAKQISTGVIKWNITEKFVYSVIPLHLMILLILFIKFFVVFTPFANVPFGL